MFALYSKGFGKAAADQNKKEFQDPKAVNKFTSKTKTGDGVEFEGNVNPGGKGSADMQLIIPVDKDTKVTAKFESSGDATITPEFKVDDGIKVSGEFKGLQLGVPGKSKLAFEYQTADFALDGSAAFENTDVANAAFVLSGAMPADFAFDGLKAGLSVGHCKGAQGAEAAFSYGTKEYDVAAKLGLSQASGVGNTTVLASFKASDDLTLAAAVSNGEKREGLTGAFDGKKTTSVTISSAFKVSGSQTSKAKFTHSKGNVSADFAMITKLAGKSSMTTSLAFANSSSAPTFGLTYTLE